MPVEKQPNDFSSDQSNSADLSKLFDYPSVGELFSTENTHRFDEFCRKLAATRENLERVVRYGTQAEAARAERAARAVEVTLEFLQNLQKMRQNRQK